MNDNLKDMMETLFGSKYPEKGLSQIELVNQILNLNIPEGSSIKQIASVLYDNGHYVLHSVNSIGLSVCVDLGNKITHEIVLDIDEDNDLFHVMSIFCIDKVPFTYDDKTKANDIINAIKIEVPPYSWGEYETILSYVRGENEYTLEDYLDEMLEFDEA